MSQFDFIIVGAGSAGCVLANRLSADPAKSVLLIEAGRSDNSFVIRMPKGFGKLLTDTTHVRHFKTEPEEGNDFRSESWPKGATLGGTSSVNGMFYNRGQPEDYDRWVELGAEGWGWKELEPYFREFEDHALGADEVRGAGGEFHISPHPNTHPLSEATIEAGVAMGLTRKNDLNRPEQEGIGYVTRCIKDGVRVSSSSAFLRPVLHRPNLTVWTETLVTKILFEDKQAVGISCIRNKETQIVRVNNEVILSAGSLQSPQLLQLSGVGPEKLLSTLDIPLVSNLSGVGENLREHRMMFVQHALNEPLSYNKEFGGLRVLKHVFQYLFSKKGLMATGSHEVCAFVKSRPELETPDVQVLMAPFSFEMNDSDEVSFEKSHGMQIFGYYMHPQSQGSVMIRSTDPAEQPIIHSNYLAKEEDQKVSVAILHYLRKMYDQPSLKAYIGVETTPGSGVKEKEDVLKYHARRGQCVYHVAGTCKMGKDEMAVVDERLRVYGVSGLRVVDCSVMPELVSVTTNGPVMAIALRASKLILEDAH